MKRKVIIGIIMFMLLMMCGGCEVKMLDNESEIELKEKELNALKQKNINKIKYKKEQTEYSDIAYENIININYKGHDIIVLKTRDKYYNYIQSMMHDPDCNKCNGKYSCTLNEHAYKNDSLIEGKKNILQK